jgi:hypothetical protein
MYSAFICAHPRCPKDPDLPAIRYAIKEFMEEQAPSNFSRERWAATYDPARKVTYCSWFLSTVVYFLDKMDFTALVPPPVEPLTLVFIAGQRRAPIDPRPQSAQPIAPSSSTSAAKPARQSRLWHGGPTPQAFLEERRNEERLAQLRHSQRENSSALARLIGNANNGNQSD